MKSTLTQKIILRIILIVLLSMVLFTVLGNRIISGRFEEFSFTLGKRYAQQIATQLSIEYEDYQNWDQALTIMDSLNPINEFENGNPNEDGAGPINSGLGQGQGLGLGQGLGQGQGQGNNLIPTEPSFEDFPGTPTPTTISGTFRSIIDLLTNNNDNEITETPQDIHIPQRGNIQNINRETIIVFDQDKKMIFVADTNQLLTDINPYDYENEWIPVDFENQVVGYVMVGS
jgi:hypothetical protein